MISIVYYSLISGLIAAVIYRWYFRNHSDDLNPNVQDLLDHPHSSTRQTKKPANRLKLRPQYIDFSCLNPVWKMRLYPSVILITYQIYWGILCRSDKLQVSQVHPIFEYVGPVLKRSKFLCSSLRIRNLLPLQISSYDTEYFDGRNLRSIARLSKKSKFGHFTNFACNEIN